MYIIGNAFKNLGRNKPRTFGLGVILCAVLTAAVGSLLIGRAADAVASAYWETFGSAVFLDRDYEKAIAGDTRSEAGGGEIGGSGGIAESAEIEGIPPEDYYRFGESAYLREARYAAKALIDFDGFKAVDDPVGGVDVRGYLVASNSKAISADFERGARRIVDGAMYAGKGEALVSRQLADLNGLAVGGRIGIRHPGEAAVCTLTIAGIFEDNTMSVSGEGARQRMKSNPMFNRCNEILSDMDTLKDFGGVLSVEAEYILNHPDLFEEFSRELYEKGLPASYKPGVDEAGYHAVALPFEHISGVMKTIVVVTLIFGGVALLLFSAAVLRTRKYEVGVLYAMGMRKERIVAGFVIEKVILAIICLVAGVGISAAVFQPVTDSLLAHQAGIEREAQISATAAEQANAQIFAAAAPAPEPPSISLRFGAAVVMEIMLVAVLLAIVSGIVSTVYVVRFEPMKLLLERV
jgi:putative ABC transport system permease protein